MWKVNIARKNGLFIFTFVLFTLIASRFVWEPSSCVIIWFPHYMPSCFFSCYKFNVSMLFHIFHSLPKTDFFLAYFLVIFPFVLYFAFTWMQGLIMIFDWIPLLCNLLILNPWFNACLFLKFCVQHMFLYYRNYKNVFDTFKSPFFLVKMVIHSVNHVYS